MKEKLSNAIKNAFTKLKDNDGDLFECPIELGNECCSRKLHEVCVNHKLANYLEEYVLLELSSIDEHFFVDIEFNREGGICKELDGEFVRPDIIIHNRKNGEQKYNFLVIECKKHDRSQDDIKKDENKLKKFMRDNKYEYQYGLQVIYFPGKIKGTLFYSNGEQIENEEIDTD